MHRYQCAVSVVLLTVEALIHSDSMNCLIFDFCNEMWYLRTITFAFFLHNPAIASIAEPYLSHGNYYLFPQVLMPLVNNLNLCSFSAESNEQISAFQALLFSTKVHLCRPWLPYLSSRRASCPLWGGGGYLCPFCPRLSTSGSPDQVLLTPRPSHCSRRFLILFLISTTQKSPFCTSFH